MSAPTLFINSDNVVTLAGLFGTVANAYVNSATVTGTVLAPDGTVVSGSAFTLTYVAASNGNYQGQIPNAIAALLNPGSLYTVRVIADNSGTQLELRF